MGGVQEPGAGEFQSGFRKRSDKNLQVRKNREPRWFGFQLVSQIKLGDKMEKSNWFQGGEAWDPGDQSFAVSKTY